MLELLVCKFVALNNYELKKMWLHGLYGLYGPHCPLSPERPLNLITHSLTVQVMAPCHRTKGHCLNQYLSSSVVQYELTWGTELMHLHVYSQIHGILSVCCCRWHKRAWFKKWWNASTNYIRLAWNEFLVLVQLMARWPQATIHHLNQYRSSVILTLEAV